MAPALWNWNRRSVRIAVVLSMLLLPAAVCDPLPPNVTSGHTISMGGLIPIGGTNLNVPSMQLAAAGNASAVFYAESLLFAGTLTVTFPNTNPYGCTRVR